MFKEIARRLLGFDMILEILDLKARINRLEDHIKDIDKKLDYNQIRLPEDYGPKRFNPANVFDRWKKPGLPF